MDVVPHSWPVKNIRLDCAILHACSWDIVFGCVPPTVGVTQHSANISVVASSTNCWAVAKTEKNLPPVFWWYLPFLRCWWWGWWGCSTTPPGPTYLFSRLLKGCLIIRQVPLDSSAVSCSQGILQVELLQDVALRYAQTQINPLLWRPSFLSWHLFLLHDRWFSTLSTCSMQLLVPTNTC